MRPRWPWLTSSSGCAPNPTSPAAIRDTCPSMALVACLTLRLRTFWVCRLSEFRLGGAVQLVQGLRGPLVANGPVGGTPVQQQHHHPAAVAADPHVGLVAVAGAAVP